MTAAARLLAVVPAPYRRHPCHRLILHGRCVCKAGKPACPACVIADLCKAAEKWCDVSAPLVGLGLGMAVVGGVERIGDVMGH